MGLVMTEIRSNSWLLERTIGDSPDRSALIINHRIYSYQDIHSQAETLASTFAKEGLQGKPVAFMLPNGLEIVLIYLACFKSGAIAMPLNRRYAAPELKRTLGNSEAVWLIIEADRLNLLERFEISETSVDRVMVLGEQESTIYPAFETLLSEPRRYTAPHLSPTTPAVLFFTSGSTGEPKGVVHTHSSVIGILDSTLDALAGITPADTILVQEPQCHISGFMETFTMLKSGGTVIVENGFDIDSYLGNINQYKPSLIVTHIDILMHLLDSGKCTAETFSSLRGIYTGGDDLPSALQQRFLDLSGYPIQLGYGMTEAIWLTVAREAKFDRRGYIGKPVKGAELRIVDKKGHELPLGEMGEIWIRGPMVMSHYWNNEKATAEAFFDGWFKTGDCAIKDESGNYYFSGRIKNIIIRNTSNIDPGEVEDALYRHPGIKAAAVIGVPDEKEGHIPVAFVVPREGASLTEERLIEFTKGEIAAYKVPTRIHYIETMPLTTSGKIDHKKLYDLLPE